MKAKSQLFILLIFFSSEILNAQINIGGKPYTFSNSLRSEIQNILLQPLDLKTLKEEDDLESQQKDIPFRFGKAIDVNFDFNNSGNWTTLSNGDRIWQLTISAEKAVSLSLNYSKFHIAPHSKLYIYSADKKIVLGGFTANNNTDEKSFATGIISRSSFTIEYYEPVMDINQGYINISQVVYGYKDIFSKMRDYGGSGNCNNNINCPIGTKWQNEKRAVVLVLTSKNQRLCSGVILNNVRQDTIPYLLTANHCYDTDVNGWIFMFNYESPNCANVDGPTTKTLVGCELKAKDTPSDFMLLRLKQKPPKPYNVYYAGWSNIDTVSDTNVCIHHPNGDIKKITISLGTTTSTSWGSYVANSHWNIAKWDSGTTEPGSSGCPLFNKKHLVIGQLHGGDATCTYDVNDNFGKFAYSWQTSLDSTLQLKHWLDPDNTGVTTLSGNDFYPVGISNLINNDNINIFPNPTNGELYISTKSAMAETLQVFNSLGGLIKEQNFTYDTKVDLSGANEGIYYVRIFSTNSCFTSKIVLTK